MKVHRLPVGIVAPVLLVGLVAVLAALQYRWLGQVSEAEREQLRRSFTQRAREFADEFDSEISRAYAALQLSQAAVTTRDWTSFAIAVDTWQTSARFPHIVRGIYLAEPSGEQIGLRPYSHDARAFADSSETRWPPPLEPVRRQLASRREPSRQVPVAADILRVAPPRDTAARMVVTWATVNAEVPALIIPVPAPPRVEATGRGSGAAGGSGEIQARIQGTFVWLQRQTTVYVIAELDGAYIRQTVLPALAAKHFPDPGPDTYRLAVVSPSGSTLFAGGLADGAPPDPERADVVVPLMTLRLDSISMPGQTTANVAVPAAAAGSERPRSELAVTVDARMLAVGAQIDRRTAVTQTESGQLRIFRPAWRLVLQHGAGSLDAAVTKARRRNLALSFGILAVLSVGIALIVLNARRAEQLAARQMEFVATVSHELRTPLTVIRSAAQNLSAGVVADAAQTRRYGELIDGEGRRLTEMVEQVLDYAGLSGTGALRLTQVADVGALVNDAMTACQPLADQTGCAVDVSVEDGLFVKADPEALRRAVQNLVTNALKHGSDGRWVGVTAKAGPDGAGPEVLIAVTDRGRGIPASELPHVFDAFFRGRHAVDQQIHGNGLGLSLVKRIVEAHGGRITVQSAAGEGSTFAISLPAAAGSSPATGSLA